MKRNRFTACMLILTLTVGMLGGALTGCTRELTEKQSAALVALQNAVTYYETNDNLSHWEELVALAAANRADGIGVNWGAITPLPSPDFPETQPAGPQETQLDPNNQAAQPNSNSQTTDTETIPAWTPIDVSAYPGAIFTALIYGEDYTPAAQALALGQNPESGSFSDAYINQHIWSMITLNAALNQNGYNYDKAVTYLLTFQNEDGGFAYSRPAPPLPKNTGTGDTSPSAVGENANTAEIKSDTDLTGIAAVALAPYYETHKRSPEMKALVSYLNSVQTETGGYVGFGGENPSTISAAIWGITALKQELPTTEDGKSPVDALLAYQNEDGSFRSQKDGEHVFDSFSTRQAMIALSDVINDVETYTLLSEDAESYRIEHISGPAISFTIDFPEESGLTDISAPLTVAENSTALDALILYGKLKEIPVTFSGGGTSAYIESIDNVSEKAYGDTSGWIYRINGETLSQGAAATTLQDGDQLDWIFVTDVNQAIME